MAGLEGRGCGKLWRGSWDGEGEGGREGGRESGRDGDGEKVGSPETG